MSGATPALARLLSSLVAVSLVGCAGSAPSEDSGGDGDADADLDADVGRDADALEDGDLESDDGLDADQAGDADSDRVVVSGPGPMTLVLSSVTVSEERRCDLDGDGTLDNGFAEMGATAAAMTVMSINAIIEGEVRENRRMLLHFPWVHERAGPDDPGAVMLTLNGWDVDWPWDASDDFSGEEPFYAHWNTLDPCGEPLTHFPEAHLAGGDLTAESGAVVLNLGGGFPVSQATLTGVVGPGGATVELDGCGMATIRELGGMGGFDQVDDWTMLEALTAGGAIYGLDALPGAAPDLDLDGDGLERVVLDDESFIETCVDGDRTVIDGRDCWADPRMADAFSLTFHFSGVSAQFAGRLPDWESRVVGTCDGGPPDPSLFDPR